MLNPDDTVALFNKAALLEATSKPDEAKAIYESILSQKPEFAKASAALANLAEQSGDSAKAEQLLMGAWKKTKESAAAATGLARLYVRQGDLKRAHKLAIAAFEQMSAMLKPWKPSAWFIVVREK